MKPRISLARSNYQHIAECSSENNRFGNEMVMIILLELIQHKNGIHCFLKSISVETLGESNYIQVKAICY